jgi:YD repeat-containing protein
MSSAKVWLAATVMTVAILSSSALAQETTTYSYDGLGRLKGSAIAGGRNSGRTSGTCFDAAGDSMRYDVATSAPATCPTSTLTPTASP